MFKFLELKYAIPCVAAVAFLICIIILPFLIPYLRKLKFGQSIREDGPKWHEKKSGTPPMGGIAFIIASVIAVFISNTSPVVLLVMLASFLFGVIGFIDDYIKVVLKRNLGLLAKQKFLMQIVVSVAFILVGRYFDIIKTDIYIPFMEKTVDLGIFIIPLSVFVMTGFSNAVNLTDGVDGLASSITAVVSVVLGVIALITKNYSLALSCAGVFGAMIGFLMFNFHPAKVFMGDTGSLFLGGFVSAMAIALKMPVLIVIIGFVYVLETLSVMLQVAYFKKTGGKRLFKMTPIHHHFEMCGWSEVKIVTVAVLVTIIAGIVSILVSYSYLF